MTSNSILLQKIVLLLSLVALPATACATLADSHPVPAGLYDGRTGQSISLYEVSQSIEPGTIVIASEYHHLKTHHDNQVRLMHGLSLTGLEVSVGMEFFYYPDQQYVEQYLSNQLTEDEFLTKINWKTDNFPLYRKQVNFPRITGGQTLALNAPKRLTAAIRDAGVENLPADLRALMPPNFTIGNQDYYERFEEVMKHHTPEEAMPRYFEAQSTWDETMAWQAVEYMKEHPNEVLVIIVGDFHAVYGGGLPARIRARGHDQLVVISQVEGTDMSEEQVWDMMSPSSKYGPRADYVWLSYEPKSE